MLSGELEETNINYSVAKIAGIQLCNAYNKQHSTKFIPAIPCNLYGEGDNFDNNTSHVIPALIKKIHEAKINRLDKIVIYGTGKVKREFLHVNDASLACYFLMKNYNSTEIINFGYGEDIAIKELVFKLKKIIQFKY